MNVESVNLRPLLPLPSFPPDAVAFAIRITLSLLLGYLVSFAIQLDSASSTGVCVAIVAQPSSGMTVSKAVWRTTGTLLGGIVALVLVETFPQDRTMLLLCFILWISLCTFVAAMLRDFRAYGAVLCGYTVGIIAVGGIDAPDSVLLATLDRVAAILIGILSVAAVNLVLSGPGAFASLVDALRRHLAEAEALAAEVLEGRTDLSSEAVMSTGATVSALRIQAAYAAAELAGGADRRRGALNAIAGILGMLSACRMLSGVAHFTKLPLSPMWQQWRMSALAALRSSASSISAPEPASPAEAFMVERVGELLVWHARATTGLLALQEGGPTERPPRLHVHYDVTGAAISALRTAIAVSASALFCILSGWPASDGLLEWQAIFTALLSMQPDPTSAAKAMAWSLPLPALAAAVVDFVLLPQASGFEAFALAVTPFAVAFSLISRHPRFQRFAAGLMLYFTLLLAPSNAENFDLADFLNNVLVQALAIAFVLLAFAVILPASRQRRLLRLVGAVEIDLRRGALGCSSYGSLTSFLAYDRFGQARLLPSSPTLAHRAVLGRITGFMDLDHELRRSAAGLRAVSTAEATKARLAIAMRDHAEMDRAAVELLNRVGAPALVAVSGLYAAAQLLARHDRALRRYGIWR